MASRDISKLVPELREKAEQLVEKVSKSFPVLIYCTGRSAEEQAKIYRKSRTFAVIKAKHDTLVKYGHTELAQILLDVGPQYGELGRHLTKAGPGESWHQYWQAFDAVPMIGGKPAWIIRTHKAEWAELGRVATELGLNWGGNWPKWADYPHFQLPVTGNPLKIKSTQLGRDLKLNETLIMRESDL